MEVSPNAEVQSLQARILDPPTLMYGQGSRQPTIVSYNRFLVVCGSSLISI